MLLGLHPLSSIEIKCVDGLLEAGRLHDQDDWRDFVNQWSTRMAQIVVTDVASSCQRKNKPRAPIVTNSMAFVGPKRFGRR